MRRLAVLFGCCIAFSANAQVLVQSSLVRDYVVSPGDRVEGTIPVVNRDSVDRRVSVYLTDYLFLADGTTRYGEPGSSPRSAAAWVGLGAPSVIVPAGSATDIGYVIEIPDLERFGTWWCTLMIEDEGAVTLSDDASASAGISSRVRFATQLAVTFGGSAPELQIEEIKLERTNDTRTLLQVDIANKGGMLADVHVTVELFSDMGSLQEIIDGGSARLYPDTSYRFLLDATDVERKQYNAIVIVDAGNEHGIGTQFVLDL